MGSDTEASSSNLESWVKAIPPNLVDSFREPEPPVIFLGSGFGKEAVPPLKTGEQLADVLRTQLGVKDNGEDLAELLQYRQNEWAGSRRDVIDWLKKELSYEQSKPGGAYRLLLELPANEFLTTNYDSLLLNASHQMVYSLAVTDHPGSYKNNSGQYRNKKREGVLGRLHGGFGTSEEYIVATTDDYIENYYERGRGWTDLVQDYFRDRRMIFIGYSIRDFTTWTSLITVLQKSRENRGGIHNHFLVSPVHFQHYSNFWNRYNISHIPLKAYQFLTAVHKLLGNLDDKDGSEDIAITAAAACARKTHEDFLPELELYRKKRAYPTKRLAALRWLKEGCYEDK